MEMTRKKHEDEYLKKLKEECECDRALLRFYHSLMWYIKSSRKYRFLYYLFNIIAISAPIIGTVLTIWLENKWISICSALSSLSVSMLSLFQCQKRWRLYRCTAEKIKILFENYFSEAINKKQLITEMNNVHNQENIVWSEEIVGENTISEES